MIIKYRPISSFYLSQTENRPLSQLRVMRDVQASVKKTLETNIVRCAKSHSSKLVNLQKSEGRTETRSCVGTCNENWCTRPAFPAKVDDLEAHMESVRKILLISILKTVFFNNFVMILACKQV